VAWRRLEFTRGKLAATAEELNLPIENLMTPETIRRVLWSPPETPEMLRIELANFGARLWQIDIVAPILETAIWFMAQDQVSQPAEVVT
jgi:ribonuclease D